MTGAVRGSRGIRASAGRNKSDLATRIFPAINHAGTQK